MKKKNKKVILFCQIVGLFFWLLPATAMDIEDAPTSVNIDYLQELYEPVDFDHQMHAENYACNACHHHTTGDGTQNKTCEKCHAHSEPSDDVSCSGCHQQMVPLSSLAGPAENISYHIDKPGIKGALHLQCLGCHRIEGGPVGCQECHAFTPEGRKRFAVKD